MAWTHINLVLLALQRHPMNSNCCRAVTELYNIIIISHNSLHEHSLYDSLYNLLQSTCDFITKPVTRHESNLRSTSFWAYMNFFVRIFRILCRSVYFFFGKERIFAMSHCRILSLKFCTEELPHILWLLVCVSILVLS